MNICSQPEAKFADVCEREVHSGDTQPGQQASKARTQTELSLAPSRSASRCSRCTFDRRWAAAARPHPATPKWPPDRAAWLSLHLSVKRFANSASCSALEKSSSRCFMWPQAHLVIIFNADAPPTPKLQHFTEHSKDSC